MDNWPAVCRPQECGGLGIVNSKLMNKALMLKWIWKLFQEEDVFWAQLVRAKYLNNNSDIFACSNRGGSQFWKSLNKIKHLFKLGARHSIRNGQRTLFWLDNWHGAGILSDRFPLIFAVCANPYASVADTVE